MALLASWRFVFRLSAARPRRSSPTPSPAVAAEDVDGALRAAGGAGRRIPLLDGRHRRRDARPILRGTQVFTDALAPAEEGREPAARPGRGHLLEERHCPRVALRRGLRDRGAPLARRLAPQLVGDEQRPGRGLHQGRIVEGGGGVLLGVLAGRALRQVEDQIGPRAAHPGADEIERLGRHLRRPVGEIDERLLDVPIPAHVGRNLEEVTRCAPAAYDLRRGPGWCRGPGGRPARPGSAGQ